jgi:hypothetical protein
VVSGQLRTQADNGLPDVSSMTTEQLEAELVELERKRRLTDEARAMVESTKQRMH